MKENYYADEIQKPKPGKHDCNNNTFGNSPAEHHLFNDVLHKRAGDKYISTDDSEKISHLLLPPKDIADKMNEVLQILPVSKRRCPAGIA
jgi:hypothetical protein